MNQKLTTLFIVTIILSFFARASGLVREAIVGFYFGTGPELDAFYYIYTFPELFITGITAALSIALIPKLSKYNTIFSKESNDFLSKLFFFTFTISVGLTIIFFMVEEPLSAYIMKQAAGISSDNIKKIYIINILQILPNFICAILLAIVTKMEKYKVITLLSIPINIIVIISIYSLSKSYGVLSLGIGMILGVIFQVIYLTYLIKRNGFKYHLKSSYYFTEDIRKFFIFLGPVYFGTVIQRINMFIDRSIAINLGTGSISALSYADRINQMVIMILVSTISMVMFNQISSNIKDEKKVVNILSSSISFSLITILPLTIFLCIYSNEVVQILFKRGQFNERALSLTTFSLIGYSIGLIGVCIRYLLNRIYYAYNDYKTPTINTIIACIINAILSIIFAKIFGIFGIALATSITMIIASILLAIKIEKNYKFVSKVKWVECIKIVILSLILGIVWLIVKILVDFVTENPNIHIILGILIGGFFILVLGTIFKIKDINIISKKFKDKLGFSSKRI